MITIETLRKRRDALMAELERGKRQYEELDRQLCALAGAIGELAELIDMADPRDPKDVQESRLGEAHQTIDVVQESAGAWNSAIWTAKREHMDAPEENGMFEPIANFAGMEHILNAVPCFVHPTSGNMYGVVIEKVGGVQQNLAVYRTRPGQTQKELIKRYIGGADSRAQIAAGGCVILQDGSLEVWASAVPLVGAVTRTGFSGVFDRVPNVDAPWSAGGVTLFDRVYTAPAWEARTLAVGELVDIPATFGVPSARSYLARVTVNAPTANVRARFGTEACPHFYTVNSRENGVDEMQQGFVPGPLCYVSPAQGTLKLWFQLIGFSG